MATGNIIPKLRYNHFVYVKLSRSRKGWGWLTALPGLGQIFRGLPSPWQIFHNQDRLVTVRERHSSVCSSLPCFVQVRRKHSHASSCPRKTSLLPDSFQSGLTLWSTGPELAFIPSLTNNNGNNSNKWWTD